MSEGGLPRSGETLEVHAHQAQVDEPRTLSGLIERARRSWPGTEALVFGDERLTFEQFADQTTTIARALHALGVRRGDKVGVLMQNGVAYLTILYGALRLGATAVPVNARFKAHELAYVLPHADLKVLFTSRSEHSPIDYCDLIRQTFPELTNADRSRLSPASAPTLSLPTLSLAPAPTLSHIVVVDGQAQEPMLDWSSFIAAAESVEAEQVQLAERFTRPSEAAMMLYTSGTTSTPKGCLLSHRAMLATGLTFGAERFPMRHGDRMWNPLPLFHLATLLPFNGCLAVGATFVGMRHFDVEESLRLLESERCTSAFAAFEPIWLAIVRSGGLRQQRHSRLRLVNVNGHPERLREMQGETPWITLISPYGCTEGGGVLALSHPQEPLEQRVSTAGRPFSGMQVMITHPESGQPLPPCQRGEIVLRGEGMFDGYYKDEQGTREAVDAEGWFHTGDLGMLDDEGRVSFLGRIKDMLKVGGENVAAAEIEEFLGSHPAIAQVQVVAAPDLHYAEVPCAFVELRQGAELTIDELIEFCRGRIATYKIPRHLRIVREWPMSGTKIQKFRLREQIAEQLRREGVLEARRITSKPT